MAELGSGLAESKRFEILRQLGEGGMGVVYAAVDRQEQRPVALKTLRRMDARNLARFKHEFRALADVTHPNLVRLYELFCECEQWFFSMELLSGLDFTQHVQAAQDRPLGVSPTEDTATYDAPDPQRVYFDETRLRAALSQLAIGVSALHGAGKVHRDIKPSNILVTGEERVVLLDFGLVTEAVRHGDSVTGLVGTVPYMAPEQAAEGAVGTAADWYSVGCVLYRALTGRAPFLGTHMQILMDKQRYEPPAPRIIAGGVPEDLNDLCVALLRTDPKVRPSGQAILGRLGVEHASMGHLGGVALESSLSAGTEHAPFVGREPELAALAQAFADRQAGAVTVLLHGESGIGKSTLVRHFCDTLKAREPSTWVLSSRCHERELMPYKAFDGIVDALARRLEKLPPVDAALLLTSAAGPLVRLFPVLRRCEVARRLPAVDLPDPQELRYRAFVQLRALLYQVARRSPLVLCIDDLQWADADSWLLLRHVLHAPEAPPLLLLATIQTGVSFPAESLEKVRELSLLPLGEADSLELASELVGKGAGDEDAREIAREAAGHPLFLAELAHEARRHSGLNRTVLLDELLGLRVAALPEDARRVVELLAVAEGPLSPRAAGLGADLEGAALERSLALLRAGHLCRASGERDRKTLDTYHNRIRAAVLARLPTPRVTEHHARLARALELCGEDPAGLIRHLEAAGETQRAAAQAETVAELAYKGLAFARAATFYRQALTLGDPARARGLRIKLGDALAKAGRGAEAAAELLLAIPGAPAAEALDLRRQATDQYLRSGHLDEGLETARAVLAEVGLTLPATPRRALLALLLMRARLRLRGMGFRVRDATQVSPSELARIDVCAALGVCLSWADYIVGTSFQVRALLYALRAGEPSRLFPALVKEAALRSCQGLPARARVEQLLAVAERHLGEQEQPELRAWILGIRGFAAYMCGQFRAAQAQAESTERVWREQVASVSFEIDSAQLLAAWSLYYQGQLLELARRVPSLLVEAQARGDRFLATNLCLTTLNAAWLVGDDAEKAQAQAQQAIARWSRRGYQLQHWWCLFAETQISLYLGHGDAALRRVLTDVPPLRRSLLLRIQFTRIELIDLRARAALCAARDTTPDREPLLRSARKDARRLRREKAPWATALATLIDAGASALQGDTARALAQYAAAATQLDQADMALHATVSRLRQGELLANDEGHALIATAHAWFAAETVKNPARWAQMIAPAAP
jgi:hypothetical protein